MRLSKSSLLRMLLMCAFTVATLMNKAAAISALDWPLATALTTSVARSLSARSRSLGLLVLTSLHGHAIHESAHHLW